MSENCPMWTYQLECAIAALKQIDTSPRSLNDDVKKSNLYYLHCAYFYLATVKGELNGKI